MKKKLLAVSIISLLTLALVVVFIGINVNNNSGDSGSLVPSVSQEHGIKLATTTQEDGSVLVTATYYPSDVELNDLTWSVEFVDEALLIEEHSAWLQGIGSTKKVTDFITLTPNGTSCNVKCTEAFGCPIFLKCQSTSNPSVRADCQLDYIRRVDSISGAHFLVKLPPNSNEKYYEASSPSPTNFEIDFTEFNNAAYPVLSSRINLNSSPHTREDSYRISYEVVLDNQLFTFLCRDWGSEHMNDRFTVNGDFNTILELSLSFDMFEKFGFPSFNFDQLNNAIFPHIMENCGGHIFDITYSYNGQHSTLTETFHFNVSNYNFKSTIEDIYLDQSNIAF